MLILSWKADKFLTAGYYLTMAIASIVAVGVAVVLKFLIDSLVTTQASGLRTSVPAIIIVLLGTRYVFDYIRSLCDSTLNRVYFDYLLRYRLQNQINYDFYQKLSHLDVAHLEDPTARDLIAKARDTMTWHPPDFLRTLSSLVGYFVTYTSSFIVLIPFGLWIPVAITLINLPILYLRAKFGRLQWSLYGSGAPEVKKLWYFTWLLSTETAIKEMRIFQSQDALLTRFKEIQEHLYDLNGRPISLFARTLAFPRIGINVILFLLAFSQLPLVLAGTMTVGSFTLLINMIDTLSGNVGAVVLSFGELYAHSLYIDHYFDVLDLPKIIREKGHPHVFKKIAPPKIEFRNVSFQYPGGPLVLKNICFVINAGENVAFVGENGAGKSTIIKLLCRFYDVTSGEILINGVNIKDLSIENWYQFLGTLFQDFVNYHFTVRDNISMGKPAKKNYAEIEEAAKKSGAYDFIQKLPKGFDTMLGREYEEGEELSVGQWQKLAIARAFYEEAPVLILDEPTSAIDAEAEYEIFSNLEKTYKSKTLILVSHRFSTVRNANKIFVVHDGEVTEQGTHEELMKQNGKYSRMFLTQAKGYQ